MSRPARRPSPRTPVLLDVRILVVAALVSAPAAYRASQGLLTPDEAVSRFLVVLVGCAALAMLLRVVWPMVAGETTTGTDSGTADGDGTGGDGAGGNDGAAGDTRLLDAQDAGTGISRPQG